MGEAQETYDVATWNALLQVDNDIATAAAYLAEFGQQYVDDLADSYLAIGEKRYLATIVSKIQRQAEDDARACNSRGSQTHRADRSANDNLQSTSRRDPEFDVTRWNELASRDSDIDAAIAAVGKFGSYYVADLAASYQAIGDKRYLQRIVETIIAEALAELDSAPDWAAFSGVSSEPETDPRSGLANNSPYNTHWDGTPRWATLAALGVFLPLLVSAAAVALYEFSIFQGAHGDADRLEAYEQQCHVCIFRIQADAELASLRTVAAVREGEARREALSAEEAKKFHEAVGDIDQLNSYLSGCEICAFSNDAKEQIARLKQQAAEIEATRIHNAAIEEDRSNYLATRGDIDRLAAYLTSCQDCLFKSAAEAELNTLRQQANVAAAQARIAELQKEQQLRALSARQVTWRMTNSTDLQIAMQFFSETRRGFAWPGSNMNWPMSPGQTSDYNLNCEPGEKICYGASAPYRTENWGVGGLGTLPCENCCVTCDGAVHAFNLMTDGGGPNE